MLYANSEGFHTSSDNYAYMHSTGLTINFVDTTRNQGTQLQKHVVLRKLYVLLVCDDNNL